MHPTLALIAANLVIFLFSAVGPVAVLLTLSSVLSTVTCLLRDIFCNSTFLSSALSNFHDRISSLFPFHDAESFFPSQLSSWLTFLPTQLLSLRPSSPLSVFLFCCSVAETFFFIAYHINLRRLQSHHPHDASTHRLQTRQERWALLERCMCSVRDIRSFCTGWFRGARFEELRRENMKDFLCWAFFDQALEDVVKKQEDGGDKEAEECLAELEEMLDELERREKLRLRPGRHPEAQCMRLSVDPLDPRHRPLFYYLVLSICGWIFHAFITYRLGFQKFYSRGEQQLLSFWGASTDSHFHNKAPVGYYYRPGSNPEKQSPIVFVHGIGVGLLCYLSFFKQLVMESDRPVVAIELPHVSSLLYPIYRPVVEDVPTVAEMVDAVEHIFRKHGFVRSTRQGGKGQLNKATFIGHSLGTTVLAWIIRHRPHLVQKAIFIDPICFMLHLPDVAYNFIYRAPQNAVETLLWWFASRELYISWTLHRCFHWHQNTLFIQDIPARIEVSIILGGQDCIVPSRAVKKYFLESSHAQEVELTSIRRLSQPRSRSPTNISLFYFDALDHAEFLLRPDIEKTLAFMCLDRIDFKTCPRISMEATTTQIHGAQDLGKENSNTSVDIANRYILNKTATLLPTMIPQSWIRKRANDTKTQTLVH